MRKIGAICALVIILTTVSGCWSRKELNDIAIVVAIGLDKKGEQYQVSAQIVNPSEVAAKKGTGGKGAPVSLYTGTGETLFDTVRKMTKDTPRLLFFSHLRMLIISEELAKEGIGKTLDLLSRNHEFRTDFYVAVAKGTTAEEILELYTVPQELIPANKMFKSLETTSKEFAGTSKITLDEILSTIATEGNQPALAAIAHSDGNEPAVEETKANMDRIKPISILTYQGIAVFKKDKLVGWLNEEESKAYNLIKGQVKSSAIRIPCREEGYAVLEIVRSKARIKGTVKQGRPEVSVHIEMENNVADVECNIDLSKTETIDELETKAKKTVKSGLEQTISKVQKKYKTDIFGFGEAIHRSSPKQWKALKTDWSEQFVHLPVNVAVDLKIRRVGTVVQSIQDKPEE